MLVNADDGIFLDVRDTQQFKKGHILGAVNIPFSQLESRTGEVEPYKSKSVVVVCKMGQQAGAAVTLLRKKDFSNVRKMSGGMLLWDEQKLPVGSK